MSTTQNAETLENALHVNQLPIWLTGMSTVTALIHFIFHSAAADGRSSITDNEAGCRYATELFVTVHHYESK